MEIAKHFSILSDDCAPAFDFPFHHIIALWANKLLPRTSNINTENLLVLTLFSVSAHQPKTFTRYRVRLLFSSPRLMLLTTMEALQPDPLNNCNFISKNRTRKRFLCLYLIFIIPERSQQIYSHFSFFSGFIFRGRNKRFTFLFGTWQKF